MNILLSIKPKHAESIIKGQKKYEFRKIIFKKKHIDTVYLYASSPIKKVIGAFRIGDIVEDKPINLWHQFNEVSGLDETEFFEYFKDNEIGFAIEITNVEKYENPIDPEDVIPGFVPPQSFCYVRHPLGPNWSNKSGENKRLQDY